MGFTLACRTRVGREAPILTIADKRHPTNPLTVAVPAATPSPRASHAGSPTDYVFTFTQAADPGSPVAWDPCEPVDVAVNLNGTPAAELDLIQLALNRVAAATGLTVRDAGLTTLINEDDLRVGQEGTDIIFAFSSRRQNPTLARVPEDNVVGYATFGSGPEDPMGWSWPTPGMVVINWPEVATMTGGPTGQRVSVYMHELGHAFGLGHANSPRQVMHAQMTRTNTHGGWGAGDAEGLRRLGQGRCQTPAATDDEVLSGGS